MNGGNQNIYIFGDKVTKVYKMNEMICPHRPVYSPQCLVLYSLATNMKHYI